ncbi:filamentous hemagglutinin N-terminal domain-containing protein [Alkalinema sp. FACHB-956]|uniref:two-partner secretion domain-containing protein n=1 Tax=Alkalinema sp. FACHB-956 TaxID=2692768 RepID=UPI0016841559|nr:filamentous hemagglutinin N-terminal domain-containing protein [Alkalinema sp. FACHB-956]MBD2329179.1 S-layer family protein [Alkalinema sp. FACHB-956]
MKFQSVLGVLVGMVGSMAGGLVGASAQVIPDGTLPTTVTHSNAVDFTIDNGARSGSNLFHSFNQFSVPTGGSAVFNNALDVQNIFARVTGGTASTIDGVIKTNGSASLFLLNPSGILFGPNAALNLGGSFVGTTANSIKFADGVEFSATHPGNPPLLMMSAPIGLQMGRSPTTIAVQGKGNDAMFPTANLGLVSSPGTTLALVGGNITFAGGVVTAPSGRIELGAVTNGTVGLAKTPVGWQLRYAQAQEFGTVNLTQRSSLWAPAAVTNPFGGIQVVGRDVVLNQSQIAATAIGSVTSGNIQIHAQRSLSLGGLHVNAQAPSAWIVNLVGQGAAGNSGAVSVQTGNLVLQDGAAIETLSLGSGKAGDIQVQAETISANGTVAVKSPFSPIGSSSSRIGSSVYASGSGGNLNIAARQIRLTDSGFIGTLGLPSATGTTGNVTVTATEDITASGISALSLISSGIASDTFGRGHGGTVQLSTGTLHLTDGAQVGTITARLAGVPGSGLGNAGDVTVTARESITLSGTSPDRPNQISYLGSGTIGAGHGGTVRVIAPRLLLKGGAGLGTSTLPVVGNLGDRAQANHLGNAGDVLLQIADSIEVSGYHPFPILPSSLGSFTFGSGHAGNVILQTTHLAARDGGSILSATSATGNAGNLTIEAKDILIDHYASIATSAFLADSVGQQFYNLPDRPTGNTGELTLNTEKLIIRNQGMVNVYHRGIGNAGQLNIQANQIILDSGNIRASTFSGQGGDIQLQVRDLILLRHGSQITATSGGSGNGGNIKIQNQFLVGTENSDIVANAFQGQGGNIQITTQGMFGLAYRLQQTSESDITASSEFGINGTVKVNTIENSPNAVFPELPVNVADTNQKIATGCSSKQTGQFILTGRGGLPLNPNQEMMVALVWNDLRDISTYQGHRGIVVASPVNQPTLVQASGFQRNTDGSIELVASPTSVPAATIATCAGSTIMTATAKTRSS